MSRAAMTPKGDEKKALALAQLGLRVFPVGVEWDAKGGKYRKRPLTSRGFKDATTSATAIISWWRANPDALVGVAHGNGIACLDFDSYAHPEAGALSDELSLTHDGPQYATASGGTHMIFRALTGKRTKSATPGVELLDGASGFFVWWGSVPAKLEVHDADKQLLAHLVAKKDEAPATKSTPDPVPASTRSAEPIAARIEEARKIGEQLNIAEADYETWLRFGMALHYELGEEDGLELWNELSATSSAKYPGAQQLGSHWQSFRGSPNPVTLGSFRREQVSTRDDFDDVSAEGWQDPFDNEVRKPILRISTMPERAALPEVQWVIAPLIARGFVTSFTGHGGAGKSTESLVMAAHVACAEQYRSFPTHAGRVLIVSLEDPEHVVWLRLYRIAETFGLDIELIRQNVTVVAVDVDALIASGQDTVLATERNVGGSAELKFTPVFDEVREHAKRHDLTVIDNSSDAYGANENSRPLVRAFIRGLQHHVAVPNNAGVLLLGHVDKVAARKTASANSYSGSTAWHNSVRSRLVLTQAEDGSDAVVFTQEKNNLAKRWTGVAHYAPNEFGILVAITPEVAQQRAADALAPVIEHILAAIRSAEAADLPVYTATSGSHTAHSVLSRQPGFPADITAKQTNAALVELRDSRRIKAVEFRTANRNSSTKWVVQETGA